MIGEPTFDERAGEVYGEALDALDRAGIRYMLGGAYALNAYTGIWRDTKDLDLFVPQSSVGPVLEALRGAGFETGVEDPCWIAKAYKGEYFADIIHATHNGTGFVEESWFHDAAETTILDRPALVVPAEETILSKIFVVARDRCDVDDVLHLIFGTRGGLDWERILSKVGENWELLLAYLHLYRYVYPSHTGYVPRWVFETLQQRLTQAAPEEQGLRFRGTMLDENSFAVDVEEWGLPDERARNREARCPDGKGDPS